MKMMNIRLTALMAAVLMAVTAFAKTPDLTGTVLDEKGEPMPFVNVVLLSLPDSTFVQGAMTDDQGHFHISTPKNYGLLKVSSVGYETQYLNPVDGLIVKMNEASLMLGEVVVKSQLPKTRVKGEAMRTTIEGSESGKAE